MRLPNVVNGFYHCSTRPQEAALAAAAGTVTGILGDLLRGERGSSTTTAASRANVARRVLNILGPLCTAVTGAEGDAEFTTPELTVACQRGAAAEYATQPTGVGDAAVQFSADIVPQLSPAAGGGVVLTGATLTANPFGERGA
jgi:hypothetical protein